MQLVTSIDYDDNAEKMVLDFMSQSSEMLEKAGCKNVRTRHETGTDWISTRWARMPYGLAIRRDSLLNEWNQVHHDKNIFFTDGSCMTSTWTQSTSIFYMALAARASHHAVEEMKKGNL